MAKLCEEEKKIFLLPKKEKKKFTDFQPSCTRFPLIVSMSAGLWKCFCMKTVKDLVTLKMSNDLHILDSTD